jgi:ATP-binding cassette subfamily F protein 3
MLSIENLTKSFGDRVLFERIGFKINPKERVGLVGRNGQGKTTLLRLICGQEAADSGSIVIPRHYRIGHVAQHLRFGSGTILEETMTGLGAHKRGHRWEAEKILAGLGFGPEDFHRPPADFSGGFQVRLNLAKALVAEPNLLLLDEPTNYLDITSIRWIVRFLNQWPGELLVVTHDRGFMDQIVTHIVGLHRQKARKISGTTEKYYAQIAQDEEIYENTRVNDEKRRKEIELFITRFRAKARLGGLVQSRVKTLAKLEKKDKLESIQTLEFSFRSCPMTGKYPMQVHGLTFGHDPSRPLVADLDFNVGAGERIAVIGKNGRGKTTLLKLLAGTLKPQSGAIGFHPATVRGVFEQTNVSSLVDSRTVEEEVASAAPDMDRQSVRNICGAMLFSGDEALKKIRVLSGGEKSRVMLGKLLLTPSNLLLLDEPTNHLDMTSADALLAALDAFDGAVVMVTHNEMFLHALAQRLIVFQGERPFVFDGTYQEFLDKRGWQEEQGQRRAAAPTTVPEIRAGQRIDKKQLRRQRSQIIAEKSRLLKPLETAIKRLEKQIEAQEAHLADLNRRMVEASMTGQGTRIGQLAPEIRRCEEAVARLYAELENVSDEHGTEAARFEAELAALGEDMP